jgi:hypothetical protein
MTKFFQQQNERARSVYRVTVTPNPDCESCQGTGKIGDRLCSCLGRGQKIQPAASPAPGATKEHQMVPNGTSEQTAKEFLDSLSARDAWPINRTETVELLAKFADRALAPLRERQKTLEAVIERDRSRVAEGVTALRKIVIRREWLGEGRGPYEWDDDRWHDEFKTTASEIRGAIEDLEKLAGDLSNSNPIRTIQT